MANTNKTTFIAGAASGFGRIITMTQHMICAPRPADNERVKLKWRPEHPLTFRLMSRNHKQHQCVCHAISEATCAEVLKAYSSIQMANAQLDTFCEACDNPPAPTDKLRKRAEELYQVGLALNASH